MRPVRTTFYLVIALTIVIADSCFRAEASSPEPAVLHIVQSRTTVQTDFPSYLATYRVLNGAATPAEAIALTGTLSLKNDDPIYSEVLWVLVYWQGGKCPSDLAAINQAQVLWTDILKNPTQSDSSFRVNLDFAQPLPMTGCVGLYFGGGPLTAGKVTMSANLDLTYRAVTTASPNTVQDLSGEYCFGQDWGCQGATVIDGEAFAVPIATLPSGHLLELYGNISDSTFDGTNNFGPLPTGQSWGSVNDFYLLPGGCGIFTENLNGQGFANPAPLATLHSWLPKDALRLASVPLIDRTPSGQSTKASLQSKVETIFSVPVKVNAGDCIIVIYARTGNGATDNETQVHALMAP